MGFSTPDTIHDAEAVLFDSLPKSDILRAYRAGRGKEIASGKFTNPESSSALVANAFGFFIKAPELLRLPGLSGVRSVSLEREVRFPWRGGLHPWLDVVIETDTHFIGIESKRYEPFREKKTLFSEAFQRNVWGEHMSAFERMRDELGQGYLHLDPVQLTKHAFALRTQAHKKNLTPSLLYLYAEPDSFPSGAPVHASSIDRHKHEVSRYSHAVAGSEVTFSSMTYEELLTLWQSDAALRGHATQLAESYSLTRNTVQSSGLS